MAEYRKTFRTWYKIDGESMIRIENLSFNTIVKYANPAPYIDGILLDPEYRPCTAEEFNEAKSIAMKRLESESIEE